jgi:hypothetical protein
MTHRENQKLIERFVKEEVLKSPKKGVIWGREMKLLLALMAEYPDDAFWSKFTLDFQLHSLAWFKTEDGAKTLRDRFNTFHLDLTPKVEHTLETAKVGEDYKPQANKPKTMAELLG